MDAADLFGLRAGIFGLRSGIYMNPDQTGSLWERPASVELINLRDGGSSFAIECGVRVQGGYSMRNWHAAKLSLRLLFDRDYGSVQLEVPMFAESRVTSFDTLVLDAHHNYTWVVSSQSQRLRAQYLRDSYTSELQTAVGGVAPHSRLVHLYLNGLYWGIYDLHERPDESFAAMYLGGGRREYDVLRDSPAPGPELVAGDLGAWNAMIGLAREGLADPVSFQAIPRCR